MNVRAVLVRHRFFVLAICLLVVIIGRNLYLKAVCERLDHAVRSGDLVEVKRLLDLHADPNCIVLMNSAAPDNRKRQPLLGQALLQLAQRESELYGTLIITATPVRTITLKVEGQAGKKVGMSLHSNGGEPTEVNGQPRQPDISGYYTRHDVAEEIVSVLLRRGARLDAPSGSLPEGEISRGPGEYLASACSSWSVKSVRALLEREPSLSVLDPAGKALKSLFGQDFYMSTLFPSIKVQVQGLSSDGNASSWENSPGENSPGENSPGENNLKETYLRERRARVLEIVRLLQAHGAHLTLAQAIRLGDASMIEQTMKLATPVESKQGFQQAIYLGNHRVARNLLEHGADPNLLLESFYPLSIATRNKDLAMMRLLLEHGADPNRHTPNELPLSLAASTGNVEAVNLLLAHGAKIDPVIPGEYSPLAQAISSRRLDVARALCMRGADVRWQSEKGDLLLAFALEYLPAFVPELLKRHAPVNLVRQPVRPHSVLPESADYFTPLEAAILFAPQYELVLTLYGAKMGQHATPLLTTALKRGRGRALPQLVSHGAQVNGTDINNEHPLTASILLAPEFARLLVEHGAQVNCYNGQHRTPLTLAVIKEDIPTVRMLLQHGADVNMLPPNDHTALYYARKHKDAAMVDLLLQAGAKDQ